MTREVVKNEIDQMPDRAFDAFVSMFSAFFAYVIVDEDEKLLKLADERITAYGGWEEAEKHFISQEEFNSRLGITEEDIENAEDDELI
jgi:predicted P-loop ATPase